MFLCKNQFMKLLIISVLSCLVFFNPRNTWAADAKSVAMVTSGASGNVENASTGLPDIFTGAMSYTIPIELPFGRNGMNPDLTLHYQSNKKNGWLGVGWDLELDAIQRSTKNSVNFSGDDYILTKKGMAIDLVNVGNDEYLYKIEGTFYRINKLIDSYNRTYWKITDKSGVKFLFGQTAASRQDNPADTNQIFKWCLDRIEDPNNNYITISYTKNLGQIYLDRIDYTGNESGTMPLTNYVKFHLDSRTDAFTQYTTNFGVVTALRLKLIDVFASGNRVKAYSLGYDADPVLAGNQYSASTGRSILSRIQQYGKDVQIDPVTGNITNLATAQKIPSTDLKYSSGDTNSFNLPTPQAPSDMSSYYNSSFYQAFQFTGDFNGDGKTDFMYWGANGWKVLLKNDIGFEPSSDWAPYGNTYWAGYNQTSSQSFHFTGDFNGDGMTDFMFWGTNGWKVLISNGHGFEPPSDWAPINNSSYGNTYWAGYNQTSSQSFHFTGDFNGDGMTDFMFWGTNGWKVLISNGHGFEPPVDWAPYSNPSYGSTYWTGYSQASKQAFHFTGDFNGDGKTDFMFWATNGWRILLSNGHGFAPPTDWAPYNNSSYGSTYYAYYDRAYSQRFHFTGDFNGDGKTDFMFWGTNGWKVLISNGNGFVSPVDWAPYNNQSFGSTFYANYNQLYGQSFHFTGDFNGDGKTDFMFWGTNGWKVLLSKGNGFVSPVDWAPYNNQSYGSTFYANYAQVYSQQFHFTGDFNGDGKTDFMYWGPSGWTVLDANGAATDLLTSITNGTGDKTYIQYKPSTRYSNLQLPFPISTVASVTTDDGNGNTSETDYNYTGGYFHIAERDFRGFHYVKTTNPTGPNGDRKIIETWFHQGNDTDVIPETESNENLKLIASGKTGYMKGKPYRSRVTDSNSKQYSEVTTNYFSDVNGEAPYFNPPLQVDNYINDNSSGYTHTKTIYSYDDYGNVIREDQYGDVSDPTDDKTIVRTFSPNIDKWIVGMPASEDIFQGIGTATKVAGKVYYYDDLTACNGTPTNNQTPIYGKLTRMQSWLNGGTSPEVRTAYNSYGNIICQRDAKGNTTTLAYDTGNTFPTVVTNPLGQQTVSQYYGVGGVPADKGLYGQLKSITDPNIATTVMEYDVFGRKTKETLPDGTWTSMSYNNFGTVGSQHVRTASSAGLWSANYFDGLGRTIKQKSSGPDQKTIVSDTFYNLTGTISKTSLPYFDSLETPRYVTYVYDPLGRVTKESRPDTTFNQACYNDRITVKIDANGHRRREIRDAYGRLVKIQEYTGIFTTCTTEEATPYATTQYTYDILGNLRFVTDDKGNITEMRYDTLGRKYYMKDPDMWVWGYGYDANGNLTSQTDAKGKVITFAYDPLNRLNTKHYPTGSDITFTYDLTTSSNSKGRLSKMIDGSGQTVYNYDKIGRILDTTKTIAGVAYPKLSFGYLNGRLDSITYPDNEKVTYGYNGANLASIGGYATYSSFNALGQPGTVTFGNGIITTHQYYTSNNRLKEIKTVKGTTPLLNMLYSYDNVGNISGIGNVLNNTRSQSLAYDELNRLKQSINSVYGTLSYSYDQIGNILTKEGIGYTYNSTRPHAVASLSNGTVYTYDSNGNMVSDGFRSITYDYDNMPTSIGTSSFTYDGTGTRVKKTAPGVTTVYVDKLYECTNGACAKYIFAGNTRIARNVNGVVHYYHPDHLGSTSIVTDASGAIAEDITYYPFGETRYDTGAVNVSHKYTGQEKDNEYGLYNYNARIYDPELGRFLTPDSIVPEPGNPQSLNRYSYVQNNPILSIDPTGHFRISLSFHYFLGGSFSYDFSNGHISAGGGVGMGGGLNIGDNNWDIGFSKEAYVDYGYDNKMKSDYVVGKAGIEYSGVSVAASGKYYTNGEYEVGAGIGYRNFSIGAGYSSIGGTTIGAGYGGVGAGYSLQNNKFGYSVDLRGSLFAGNDVTSTTDVQGAIEEGETKHNEQFRDVSVREGGLLQLVRPGTAAITLGDIVNVNSGSTKTRDFKALMVHEFKHVIQYRNYGFVPFLGRYLINSAIYGYWNNPMEVEARKSSGGR